MRSALSALALAAALLFASAARADEGVGHIQIRAEAGVEIELDGTQKGVVEGAEGVIFRAVPPGVHHLVARRPGHEPQTSVLRVDAGQVVVHNLLPWRPKAPKGTKKGPTGALLIQTFPVEATVDAKRLGWNKIKKGEQPFVATKVPAGEHKITFCNEYKCIDYRAQVHAERLLAIFVDFEPAEIRDVTAEHHARMAAWSRDCSESDDWAACKHACEMDTALSPQKPSSACLTLARAPTAPPEPEINQRVEGEIETVVEPVSQDSLRPPLEEPLAPHR